MSEFKVAIVDDGAALQEFMRVTESVPKVRRYLVQVGAPPFQLPTNVERISFDEALKTCAAFVFCKVPEAVLPLYKRCFEKGVPVVVYKGEDHGLVRHEMNGYLFIDENWATHWLIVLAQKFNDQTVQAVPTPGDSIKVSVITPTYRRDPNVLLRCLSCMKLQTVRNWEQIVCSDGPEEEPNARRVVESFRDARFKYQTLGKTKRENDFGNTVRAEMMKKSAGEYILFLDDDNLILPDYLERMTEVLDNDKDAGFAVCRILHFGPLHTPKTNLVPPVVLEGNPVKLHWIDPLQCLVRREAMLKVGWDCSVGYLSDGVTLERLGNIYRHVRIPDILGIHY